ncbi:MAG: ABC transporter permease [Verrucomicrobiota bacterium]|nr:ABC transporter permease [Verrucomicrobiota bacterium]
MLAYIIRRVAYAFPILFGVNVALFSLFFFVNSPDVMARQNLGEKRVTPEQIENWKREHGYHLPRFFNAGETGWSKLTQTIFWQKSMRLFIFDFGKSDSDNSRIGEAVCRRVPYSLFVTIPIFLIGMAIGLVFAVLAAFYRATYIDAALLVVCVFLMSIPLMLYILAGQYLLAIVLKLTPISGFARPLWIALKFLVLPVIIGVVAEFGSGVRYDRTIFLEEINKDYVRTARAKGLGEVAVLFKHALKNAMIPILTSVVVAVPFLMTGSLLLEKFFGIPGMGNYLIDAIHRQDFAIVRAMVFLGSVLYVGALIAVDVSYTLVDPRVRLK